MESSQDFDLRLQLATCDAPEAAVIKRVRDAGAHVTGPDEFTVRGIL
jgi:hypothetical protein